MSLLFPCKVFLVSPRPTYLGNKSSSRIAVRADLMIKPPFGERARPGGRKMKHGPVPLLHMPVTTQPDTKHPTSYSQTPLLNGLQKLNVQVTVASTENIKMETTQ